MAASCCCFPVSLDSALFARSYRVAVVVSRLLMSHSQMTMVELRLEVILGGTLNRADAVDSARNLLLDCQPKTDSLVLRPRTSVQDDLEAST